MSEKPLLRVYLTFSGGNPEPYEVESVDLWEDVRLTKLPHGGTRIEAVEESSTNKRSDEA